MRKTNVRKLNKVSYPFFRFSGYNFWRNLKDIPSFLRAVHTLFKDGVPPQAYYETYAWFIDVMEMIVKWYRNKRAGTPFVLEEEIKVGDEEQDKRNEEAYNAVLDEMLLHLEGMKEENYNNEEFNPDKWKEIDKQMNEHKDKFFSLFSEYFFTLWD